jgi:hypothetical protein
VCGGGDFLCARVCKFPGRSTCMKSCQKMARFRTRTTPIDPLLAFGHSKTDERGWSKTRLRKRGVLRVRGFGGSGFGVPVFPAPIFPIFTTQHSTWSRGSTTTQHASPEQGKGCFLPAFFTVIISIYFFKIRVGILPCFMHSKR